MLMTDTELDRAVKDGWITRLQRQKLGRNYASWLARSNKGKNHKPKPSLKMRHYGPEQTGTTH